MLSASGEKLDLRYADLAPRLAFEEQRELLHYWERVRGRHDMPAREDVDPADIPRILPHIGLIDIVEPGPRFRYRLVGAALSACFSERLEGRFVEDCKAPDYAAYLCTVYQLPYSLRRPVLVQERTAFITGCERAYSRLLLPLGRDHRTPDMILYSTMSEADRRPARADGARLLDPQGCAAIEVFAAVPQPNAGQAAGPCSPAA